VTGYPRSGKLPAPSRRRSPTLSQTARDSRLSPTAVSRWSKIGPIDRPRQHVCKHRRHRIPKVGKLPAPSRRRSPTLSQTVRVSLRSPASPFLDGRKSVPSYSHVHLCASVGVTGYPRSANCPRRRAVALPHSRQLCAPAGTVPSPFVDGRKSVAPTTCANLRASTGVTGYPRSANCPRRRAVPLSWTTLVRRSGSPYAGLTLPPHVGRRCTYLHHATQSG